MALLYRETRKADGPLPEFVHFDEKTLKQAAILLAFCALFLYNNANLLYF